MSPLGGWEGHTITGTAGVKLYDTNPRQEGSVPASAETAVGGSQAIRDRRDREARLEAQMQGLEPGSPRHSQAARVLAAAQKIRKRLEREAKK